jgi:hypothetical protein
MADKSSKTFLLLLGHFRLTGVIYQAIIDMRLNDYLQWPEELVISELKAGKFMAYLFFYKQYHEDLLLFTYTHLPDLEAADLIVDEVFTDLWVESRHQEIPHPLYRFLILKVDAILEKRGEKEL